MDVNKLTPAPWIAGKDGHKWIVKTSDGGFIDVGDDTRIPGDDTEFIAMARNAFEVMMDRGWGVQRSEFDGRWYVYDRQNHVLNDDDDCFQAADPFTALVEAEAWYKANVEQATT